MLDNTSKRGHLPVDVVRIQVIRARDHAYNSPISSDGRVINQLADTIEALVARIAELQEKREVKIESSVMQKN